MNEERLSLTLQVKYKSLKQLKSAPLPKLTVITGKNGTGKTHLLEAISNGSIQAGNLNRRTSLVSHRDFIYTDQGVVNRQHLENQKQQYIDAANETVSHLRNNQRILSIEHKKAIRKIAKQVKKPLFKLETSDFEDQNLFSLYNNYVVFYRDFVARNARPDNRYNFARRIFDTNEDFIEDASSREYILSTVINEDFEKGILPTQLSFLIFDYSYQIHTNRFLEYQNKNYGTSYRILSEQELETKFGPKPWTLLNDLLANFEGFQYELDFDEEHFNPLNSDYTLRFKRNDGTDPNFRISTNDLSSGEQTILAFVCSLFSAVSNRDFPKLLLLDEIDATLHPTMCSSFIRAIEDVLVKKNGVSVIFVTHSPSTVASAPNGSVFVMDNEDGTNSLQPEGKTRALRILSSGFIGVTEEDNKILVEHRISSGEKAMLFFEGESDVIYFNETVKRFLPELTDLIDASGADGIGGLNNLFNVIKGNAQNILTHGRKAVLVYDCDASARQETRQHLVKLKAKKIDAHPIPIGIENLLPATLIERAKSEHEEFFYTADGVTHSDDSYKIDLAKWVCDNATDDEFEEFKKLANRIKAAFEIE